MVTFIKDLAPELQELCHKRQKEQGNSGTFDGNLRASMVSSNFDWVKTPEGLTFWRDISDGKCMKHSPFYPKQYFEIY